MAKTAYLKDQASGGAQALLLGRRFASDTFRTLELPRLLQKPSFTNGSAQPRPPASEITAVAFMEGEPAVSRRGVLQESLSHFRTSPRAFTVLELVMVVGVLSVVLAVVLPTLKTVHEAALRKRAQAEATALAQAAIRYKTEYGFWPGQLEIKDEAQGTVQLRDAFKSDEMFSCIISRFPSANFTVKTSGAAPIYIDDNSVYEAFRRVGEKQGDTFVPNPLNPKGIHFLDLKNEDDPQNVNFPDPWDKPLDRRGFIIIMGLNPKSSFTYTVTAEGSDTPLYSATVDNTIAFAFSYGPAGKSSTNYIYSAGVSNEP